MPADVFIFIADAGSLPTLWQVVVGAWVFAVGACVGSFLNVVIYRLPAGLSIAYPPSHCPACKRPIRVYDNIPIVSWLLLRGRCRRCHAPIPSRYAWVELCSGLALLGLAATGPLAGCGSFDDALGAAEAVAAWGQVAFLAVLLASVWSAAMIARDGHRPPNRLFATPLVVGLGCGFAFPSLYSLPINAALGEPGLSFALSNSARGLVGAAVAATAASLVAASIVATSIVAVGGPARKPAPGKRTGSALTIVGWAAIAGLFLGWQMALAALAIAAVMHVFDAIASRAKALPRSRPPETGWLVGHAASVTIVALSREAWTQAAFTAAAQETGDVLRWWPLAALAVIAACAWTARLAVRRLPPSD
jgi:leader peptidase (prepilin peptidase)/N-methyltransferase